MYSKINIHVLHHRDFLCNKLAVINFKNALFS